ncbi:hypothetical protein [Streptomyces sp. NPDC020742]|uniref:hypothetical protein n=1 Tax=unclassified Streptomyces TaxID=2593676 RepID=UPI0033C58C0A
MRKDLCIAGTPLPRLCRILLPVVGVVLAFLLGAVASGATATSAFAASAAPKPAGAPPAVKPGDDKNEEKSKREAERGQPRSTARASVDVPRRTGRPLPPYGTHDTIHRSRASEGAPAGHSSKAASRPERLPVLHCVFRC